MCLAVPMLVLEVTAPGEAEVEALGVRRRVRTDLVGRVCAGDYLLIHAGSAIEIVDLAAAEESLALWEEFLEGAGGDE